MISQETSMARTEATLNLIGLTQYLDHEYWNWSDQEKQALSGGAGAIVAVVVSRLETAGCQVESAYGIVHDRDEREVWDELAHEVRVEPKPEHLHAVIRFVTGSGGTLGQLAAWIGVEQQYVEKAGRGRFAHDNMLSYLTHAKYAEKFQYAPEDVATVRGPDYQGIDALSRDRWYRGRASVKKKQAAEGVEDLVERALTGRVTLEQIMLTDELYDIYARNKRVIDDAFDTYGARRAMRAAKALREGKFTTTVIYVAGKAGAGKTMLALDLINAQIRHAAQAGECWSVYRAATSNPLDDWRGEEVILHDDLRASSMTATEWLLLLDPRNASPASARYRNKQNVAPRLIVITASIDPVEFFFYVRQRGDVNEALDQFIRRLSATVQVVREDDVVRYKVSRMGEVEEYERIIDTRGGRERLILTQGALDTAEVVLSETVTDVIVGEVARRSTDVALPGFDWDSLPKQIEAPPAAPELESATVFGP